MSPTAESDTARWLSYVSPEPNTGCWLWTGPVKPNRFGLLYGRFWWHGRYVPAHSFSKGARRNGQEDHHTCPHGGVTLCVNPDHIERISGLAHRRHHAKQARRLRRQRRKASWDSQL